MGTAIYLLLTRNMSSAAVQSEFKMPRPNVDAYKTRANNYLAYIPIPADITYIIAEYGSSLVFKTTFTEINFDCVEHVPRPLPADTPELFKRRIRILASAYAKGAMLDLLSDYTWRERFDCVRYWVPFIEYNEDYWMWIKSGRYPDDGCAIKYTNNGRIFMYIHGDDGDKFDLFKFTEAVF